MSDTGPIPIFTPGTDPAAVDALVQQLSDACHADDLSGAIKQPTDPVLEQAWQDFWTTVLDWFANHPLIPAIDPNFAPLPAEPEGEP